MSKKTRTGQLTSPANVNAANHLSYLFQVSGERKESMKMRLLRDLDGTYSSFNNSRFEFSSTFSQTNSCSSTEETNSFVREY